jgi:diguanylate cyclase
LVAADALAHRSGQNGRHEEAAQALEQALVDQAAVIRSTSDTLARLDLYAACESGGRPLLHELAALVDQTHALRDRLHDMLATLLAIEGRLESVPAELSLDRASGLPNRIGVEQLFHEWWQADPRRERPLSVAIIDIDRFVRVNERLGTRAGDRTLVAFGRLLGDLIRKDRGYDRVARLGGQSFLMFYGDTTPRNALSAVERLRQTIEATSWDDQAAEFELSISCGVVDVRPDDTLSQLLRRLDDTLLHAKRAGRNRAAIDEGQGPTTVDPPQFSVKGRVVDLGSE